MHKFKQLEIWKQSRSFCTQIYSFTNSFPNEERFGLTNQLRRAAVSIPSNIAEGSSRKSNKDFARFLEIAIGSAYEIETQLLISSDLNFIAEEKLNTLNEKLQSMTKMMYHFKKSLNPTV
jgi:four helix bundle protein